MAQINAKNNEFLRKAKDRTTPALYSLLVDLVNEGREDLAEVVFKIDFLLMYANSAIKKKDFEEAKEGLDKAKARFDLLKKEGVSIDHLEKLYQEIASKCKA
jgi:hypothetical protein